MSRQRGSIEKVGSEYRWRYFYRDANGQRASKSGRAFTKREASDAMALSMSETIRSGRAASSSITLSQYLDEWMPTYAGTVRATTSSTAATLVAAYIVPRLGRVRLVEMKPRDVERFLAELATDGKRGVNGHGGLSAKTIRNIHGVLHRALDDAMRNDLITRNPAARIRLPRTERPDLAVWDRETLARFLAVARETGDPMYAIWRLVAVTGMRRGEILGLEWGEVDLVDSTVRIVRTRVSDGSQMVESLPKTRAGRRTISIDEVTRDALALLRNDQEATAEALEMPAPRLVASNPDGSPMSRYAFQARWRAAIKRAGVPICRFHDLRHTWATMRLSEGVPDHIVAGRIGHANANTTRAIYAEYLPRTDRDEAHAWGRDLDNAVRVASACADRVPTDAESATSSDTDRHERETEPRNGADSVIEQHSTEVPPLGFEPRTRRRKNQ